MNENYETPVLEIAEFKVNCYASIDESEIINPSPEEGGSTGWLPWL